MPSGASTGEGEALEVRDSDPSRYFGRGVRQVVHRIIEEIAPSLRGHRAEQQDVDRHLIEMDGTPNKSRLGANGILAVSLALARALAVSRRLPLYRSLADPEARVLPVPLLNVLNGGAHADNTLDFQEFMIVPVGAASFADALRAGSEIFHTLQALLHEGGLSTAVGDEGGFAPRVDGTEHALHLLTQAIDRGGYTPGEQVWLALDPAASELAKDAGAGTTGTRAGETIYHFAREGARRTAGELIELYADLIDRYPVRSIEDGLAEEDWTAWQQLTQRLEGRAQIVGDDLFVTSLPRLRRGIEMRAANAVLIKPNQIGTLTETLEAVDLARRAGFGVIISHRSGETCDTTIADLAVATGAGQIKTGAPSRGERVAKYNRLLGIEEELGDAAVYAGPGAFRNLLDTQ